jgi:hypothetical protein
MDFRFRVFDLDDRALRGRDLLEPASLQIQIPDPAEVGFCLRQDTGCKYGRDHPNGPDVRHIVPFLWIFNWPNAADG